LQEFNGETVMERDYGRYMSTIIPGKFAAWEREAAKRFVICKANSHNT
jgi:hypothetical protein